MSFLKRTNAKTRKARKVRRRHKTNSGIKSSFHQRDIGTAHTKPNGLDDMKKQSKF